MATEIGNIAAAGDFTFKSAEIYGLGAKSKTVHEIAMQILNAPAGVMTKHTVAGLAAGAAAVGLGMDPMVVLPIAGAALTNSITKGKGGRGDC